LVTLGKKGVLVVQGFRQYVSLRNYRHFFFFELVASIIVFTCLFLNIQPLHLCDSHVTKRNLTNVTIHTCNNK